ncbi:FecCD family ABC transporter permease [Microbacterium galbinum]|uniref:FecCD family ABC transporter permease n=1 Tax=Microbacterium galbinum TaxID=2851646 RepID=UPI001FFD2495|nr:iron chelate uptake ABC transporter family permease subunit [Microbacterium galbinum]MCK2028488.1 iron chelate uptake ABC transporter family permease subunit [Microbacterium galbinum]
MSADLLTTPVDAGRHVFTPQASFFSRRIGVRATIVALAATALAIAVGVFALTLGDAVFTPGEVVATLLGVGEPRAELVIIEWRLPRVLGALVFGAALGIGGAIFQSLTRNPLGSPDVIGFDAGAYTGALIVITTFGVSVASTAAAALIGGTATALVVYLLAFRRGFTGFRLIIVGIGIASMLASVNTWIVLNANLNVALLASAWGAGSLNLITAEQVGIAACVIIPIAIAVAMLADSLHMLELGDDAATALGVRTGGVRLTLVILGVGLTAVVTAMAGPIAFISLAAPQIARRLTGSASVTLTASAALGALLLVASDVLAQRLFAPTQIPIGLVTVCLGGVYLVWLLIQEARRR